ncbi:hypothetical protein HOLleu_25526 [Holothuria leucospilota]|uniref:Mutator-like transposase domain-containing protein n=1 Tax=Holothuria leucospilota TaxID=206669 RepID=A0A9Q1BT55_HOLLE|nr:hypothetical protein HOLleu_25526 [Holothuria leucospilota]
MAPSRPNKKQPRRNTRFRGYHTLKKKRLAALLGSSTTASTPSVESFSGTGTSASRRKLSTTSASAGLFSSETPPRSDKTVNHRPEGYRLIDAGQFADVMYSLHLCNGAHIIVTETESRRGLAGSFSLSCSACGKNTPFHTSGNITDRGKSADINRRMTYAAMEVGLGREGLADMCSILNMPPPVTDRAYQSHVKVICRSAEEEAEQQMQEAVSRARAANGVEDNESIVDLPVSFDGTWAKRGYTSNFGVGVVISADTGEVLDREVLSKICAECTAHSGLGREELELWWEGHQHYCQINYSGSSPAMETAAAKIIWERSISKYNVRYRSMISDGDSKAFNQVQYTYGNREGDVVEKLDCIGHVGKRMFRALDNFRKENKGKLSDGKTVGEGKGRLTAGQKGVVGRLSELYRNAIRKNVNKEVGREGSAGWEEAINKMKRAIMAVLYHEVKNSSDAERHQFCPTDDWCEYNRTGSMEDKSHHLDVVFLDLLKPIFERLSEKSLLQRCLPGFSQNANESFNALIWKRCPKHLWRGPYSVKVSTNLAVLQFNSGALQSRNRMLSSLNLQGGAHTNQSLLRKDKCRVQAADRESMEAEKKKKKAEKNKKSIQEEEHLEQEGVTYESGAF